LILSFTMKYEIFNNNFFIKFQAPNAEEFIKELETENNIDNSVFSWGSLCTVDRVPLTWQKYIDFMSPSLHVLSDHIGKPFQYIMTDPWLNIYSQGGFQEIHDHWDNDFSCVLFLTESDNFYFHDRNTTTLSLRMRKLLGYPYTDDNQIPKVNVGDIIFFPSHMLHGVSPNKNQELRKTFSCNFKITDN